jgi:tetratricopeptide (TPR) repeat protein
MLAGCRRDMNLEPPETHHLRAAIGWLELGNPAEAGEEIARIRPAFLHHPDVLQARWEICAACRSWDAAVEVAELLVSVAPERVAWAALRPAFDKFPKVEIIPYNLACYAAQFGRLEEAWEWLHKAMDAAGDAKRIRTQALSDPDLQPLWERLREL